MPPLAAIPLFLASLTVTLLAARLFARRLDRLGIRFGFPEALIGLLTALAADGPEISSALFALIKGAHNVTVGVLVGSNAFNLAAMIGLSGLLAGAVIVSREVLALEGLFAGAMTIIASAVLLRWVAAPTGAILAACAAIPYLVIVLGGAELLAHPWWSGRFAGAAARLLAARPRRPPSPKASMPDDPAHHLFALIVLDVVLIAAGSAGMVQAVLSLGHDWRISQSLLALIVLAPLTSVPNAITAVRLGLAGRGAALVGETLNSNTINVGAGVIAPALFVSFPALTGAGKLQLSWMVAMTLVCLALLAPGRGLRRGGALVLIVLYLAFAATAVA